MNNFNIIAGLILYGLTFLCFYIPYKKGKQSTAYCVGITLGVIITLTLIGFDFFAIIFWLLIVMFQIVFISYWIFIAFNKKKSGQVVASILTIGFVLLVMQPWISDWTFCKKDVTKILSFHNIELNDDFNIVTNEAGGLRDFYETFTVKLSDKDFGCISNTIKNSNNYKGVFNDYSNIRLADFKTTDTIDFETDTHFEREYWSDNKMENGTYHFRFQLDKKTKELNYIGSDE